VVKSPLGRIAKFEFKQRNVPEPAWLIALGQALDRVALFPEVTAIQDRRKFEYEFDVSWVDDDIFDRSRWGCQEWLQSSVMDAVTSLDGESYSEDFRPQLEEGITNYLANCLSSLKSELNGMGVELASAKGAFKCSLYNYFQSDDAQIIQARQQAIGSFPFLAERILLNSYEDVRQAIDKRVVLAPALAKRFKISVALLKRICKFPFIQINDRIGRHLNNPETLWPLFSNVPLEKVPNNEEQWAGFNSLIRRIYDLTRIPIGLPLNRSIIDQCIINTQARQLFIGERWRDTQMALESLLSAWAQIARYVLRGKHFHTEADLRTIELQTALIQKVGIAKLAKLASKWFEAYRHAERVCEASTPNAMKGSWPTILKTPLLLGELLVVPMATAKQLYSEGKKMDNCVSSYSYDCQRGRCQIWSLRDDTGKPMANLRTYVAEFENGTKTIMIAELKAPKNKPPSPEAIQSSQLLLEAITAHPEDLKTYLVWQERVAPLSMQQITEAQYVKPVIMAMRNVLSGQFDLTALFAEMLGEDEDLERLAIEN